MKFLALRTALLIALLVPVTALAWDNPSPKLTDMAALNIQDKSIKKLEALLKQKQYQNTAREPEFLYRLADLYLERSGLSFRISEGTSVKSKSPLYHNSLKESVRVFSLLINKYPHHAFAALSHFKRGKAYKELADVPHAREDYLYLNDNVPDFDYLDSALLDLADFAQEANQHQEALSYLYKIEKMPSSDYVPIALHKAAWSHFNLGSYDQSIAYVKKEIDFYYVKIDAKKTDTNAETAFLESAFNDLSLFYFEAINKKSSFASVKGALDTFRKLDTHQKYFGPTTFKFAKLLKAYTLLPELDELRKSLVNHEDAMPETAEVVLLLFQFHFDRRDFKSMMPLLADIKTIRNEKNQARIEQILSGALADLHKLVLKNKMATERAVLVKPLITLTESVSELLGPANATALLSNYALAETLFELGDFAPATEAYQHLLKPEFEAVLATRKLTHSAVTLRLLSARYQELKKDSLIPEKLKIEPLEAKVQSASKEQMNHMSEWITWNDNMAALPKADEEKTSYDAFELEASKLLYVYFDRERSVTRLLKFGSDHADTADGTTALSIVLDTLAQSNVPTRLYDTTQTILGLKNLKNKNFIERTKEMSASAHFKVTMDNKDPAVTLARTEECLQKFVNSKIAKECQTLHAKTLLEMNQFAPAEAELTKLMLGEKDEMHLKSFLLLRADARTKQGNSLESIQDLTRYQSLTQYQDPDITEQILAYSWFGNDKNALHALLANPKVCQGKNASHCDQYRLVMMLEDGHHSTKYQNAFKETVKAPKEVQSIWALYAMEDPKKLPFQDRLILLQRLAHSWEALNPLLQIRLYPRLVTQVTETLTSVRISAPGIAPITSDPASIERRMKLMQEIDQTFAKVMKFDWLAIKKAGMAEMDEVYTRLIQDLRAIQTPEDLLKPFVQKLAEIKRAQVKLAEMDMKFVPVKIVAAPVKTADGVNAGERAPDSVAPPITSDTLLTSEEVKIKFPPTLWSDWTKGVKEKRRDYLFHLISSAETSAPDLKSLSPILKGLVLLLGNSPSEAYALIETAPGSSWKDYIVQQFQRSKP